MNYYNSFFLFYWFSIPYVFGTWNLENFGSIKRIWDVKLKSPVCGLHLYRKTKYICMKSTKRKYFENQYKLKIHWFLNENQVHKTILRVFLIISYPFPYIFLPFRVFLSAFPFVDFSCWIWIIMILFLFYWVSIPWFLVPKIFGTEDLENFSYSDHFRYQRFSVQGT